MKKLGNEKDLKKLKRQKLLLRAIFVLVFALLACQIFSSNLIAASGDRIQLLEQRSLTLSSQNEVLKKEIAEVTSLANLAHEAQNLGLVKNRSVLYLQTQVNVAMEVK